MAGAPVILRVAPNGKENRVQAAFPHARNIDVAFGVAMPEIEMLEEETLRRVVMRIQHDCS